MNEQEQRRMIAIMDGIGYFVFPVLFFGLGWLIMWLVLGEGDPKFGNPVTWASLLTIVFVGQGAIERGSRNPVFADIARADFPKTKLLAALKMTSAALYTVVFSVVFALFARDHMGQPLSLGIPIFVAVITLPLYLREYRKHAARLDKEAAQTSQ